MSRRRTRRNPDLLGDALIVGVIGVAGYVAYRALSGHGIGLTPPGGSSFAYSTGFDFGSAAAAGASQVASGAAAGAWQTLNYNGQDICTVIREWRDAGAPSFALGLGINLGQGDPHDWQRFRDYSSRSAFVDPGPTPPACF